MLLAARTNAVHYVSADLSSYAPRDASAALLGSNTTLDPKGIDRSLFEDPTDEYEQLSLTDEAAQLSLAARPSPIDSLVAILQDDSLSTSDRLSQTEERIRELFFLESDIPPHPVFLEAARMVSSSIAEAFQAASAPFAIKGDRQEMDEALETCIAWATLSPAQTGDEAAGGLDAVALEIARDLMRAFHDPSLRARRRLAEAVSLFLSKGWVKARELDQLIRCIMSPPPSIASSSDQSARTHWLEWAKDIQRRLEDAALTQEVPRAQDVLESVLPPAVQHPISKADLASWFGTLSFEQQARKWLMERHSGGPFGLSSRLFAVVLGHSVVAEQEIANKRYPSELESYYMLRAVAKHCVEIQDAGKLWAAYDIWIATVREAANPTALAAEDQVPLSNFMSSVLAHNPRALVPFPAPPTPSPLTLEASGDPRGKGFDIFLSSWARLHRAAPSASPKGAFRDRTMKVLRDMIELRLEPSQKEWSMVLNALIRDGKESLIDVDQLGMALGVFGPQPDLRPRMCRNFTVKVALRTWKPNNQPTLSTRISALQACLNVPVTHGGRLLVQAERIFDALWQQIIRNESISAEEADQALMLFLRDIRHAPTPLRSALPKEKWSGVAAEQITREAILKRPREVRVLQRFLKSVDSSSARKPKRTPALIAANAAKPVGTLPLAAD